MKLLCSAKRVGLVFVRDDIGNSDNVILSFISLKRKVARLNLTRAATSRMLFSCSNCLALAVCGFDVILDSL